MKYRKFTSSNKMGSVFKVIVHEISSELSLADFTNLFKKYGEVMSAYINTRNAYGGKVSGYVVFRNRKECIEAIAELNSRPPHHLNLQATFSLDETAQFDANQRNHPSAEHAAKFLSSSYPHQLQSGNYESNCKSSNCDDIRKQAGMGGMKTIEPTSKFPTKSGRTPEKRMLDSGLESKSTNCKQISKAQSEKGFKCNNDLDKTGKGDLKLQKKSRHSSSNNLHRKPNGELCKPPELSKAELNDNGKNCTNYHSLRSADGKCPQSIKEAPPSVKGKAEKGRAVTSENIPGEKINKEKNGIVTAKDIREANFKKDSSRATLRAGHLNISRCSTWGLLSDDPKTQIVNFDLCTQQKKLSTDTFTEVVIYHPVGPGEYWIHCKNDLLHLKLISQALFSKAMSVVACTPIIGEYYSVNFEKTSYRCRVLSLEQTKAMVQLIDFGISSECEVTNLSELPEVMKNYYAQAIHVKLDPWTPEKYLNLKKGDTFSLKAIETVDEITKVQVDGVLYSQINCFPESFVSNKTDLIGTDGSECKITVNVQWPPSVLNFLKLGQETTCTVLRIILSEDEQKDEIIIAIAYNDISRDMVRTLPDFHRLCLELTEDHSFRPAVGELIAVYYEAYEHWVRAVVLSVALNCWLVACCDFGVVLEVNKIRRMPKGDDFSKIPCFAARCRISFSWLPRDYLFSKEWIKENSTLRMKVCQREDKHLKCQLGLVKGCPLCEVSMGIWVPQTDKPIFCNFSPNPESLRYTSLSSGTVVRIVSYYMTLIMYVQPWNKESQEQIEHLHDNINTLVEKAEPLKVAPVIGKMYICTFSQDMKYYRAVVNKVKNLEQIYVTYVDFGNSEMVSLSNLFEITSELEEVPCFAVKIGLKKKFIKLLNKNAFFFLSSLTDGNEELTLICPDGNLRSCDLLRKNGNLLSDILKELVDPTFEIKS